MFPTVTETVLRVMASFNRERWIEEERRKSDMAELMMMIDEKNQKVIDEIKKSGAGSLFNLN